MESAYRIRSTIVDLVTHSRIGPSKEIHIDLINIRGDLISRLKLYGHQYVAMPGRSTQVLFTFSSSGYPYRHDQFVQFVEDIRAKRDTKFAFDVTATHSVGFTSRGGVLRVEAVYGTTALSTIVPNNDFLVDDLEEIARMLHRYTEETAEKELQEFSKHLSDRK